MKVQNKIMEVQEELVLL